MNNSLANFKLRFLAWLNDWLILFLPHSLFFYFLLNFSGLFRFVYSFIVYLVLIFFPTILVTILFYHPFLVSHFGGTLGKMLTGLKITDEEGKLLSYKLSFFRSTVGYGFSSMFFFLGFLSVIKDPKKQGWHDKAVGSKVIVTQNLWIISLAIALLLTSLNGYLIKGTLDNIVTTPAKEEFINLLNTISKENNQEDDLQPEDNSEELDQASTPQEI